MEPGINAQCALAYATWLLLQLLNALHAIYLPLPLENEEEEENLFLAILDDLGQPVHDGHAEIRVALQNF